MSIELKMNALSPTMETGTLAKWLVSVGESVRAGDIVAEIETDKATLEMETPHAGRIAQLIVREGTSDVAVGSVLAILAEADTVDNAERSDVAPPHSPPALQTPITSPPSNTLDIFASPLARRIAEAEGISLTGIRGSGLRGRIMHRDLTTLRACPEAAKPPSDSAAPPREIRLEPPTDVPHEVAALTTMRRTIARRMQRSKQTAPHFYLSARCKIDPLLELRRSLNSQIANGVHISVNDMLIKAMALAINAEPSVNVQIAGETMYRFTRVDISMAVAVPGGLITPVIHDAGALTLSAIAEKSRSLSQRARNGELTPEEYAGGTASISNLGMFGIDEIFPVLNPPQSLILGVGAGIEQPSKLNNEIGLATIMAANASFDHRVIDGADAARFLVTFKDIVEEPLRLLSWL